MSKNPLLSDYPLIGLSVKVMASTNPSNCNHTGRIVDETHGTLVLFDGLRRRTIPKKSALFAITLPDGKTIQLEGKTILGHPAERIRRAKKQRW